jgi:hypothetical protein
LIVLPDGDAGWRKGCQARANSGFGRNDAELFLELIIIRSPTVTPLIES